MVLTLKFLKHGRRAIGFLLRCSRFSDGAAANSQKRRKVDKLAAKRMVVVDEFTKICKICRASLFEIDEKLKPFLEGWVMHSFISDIDAQQGRKESRNFVGNLNLTKQTRKFKFNEIDKLSLRDGTRPFDSHLQRTLIV